MPTAFPRGVYVCIRRVGTHRNVSKVFNSFKKIAHVLCYLPKEITHALIETNFDFEYVLFYTVYVFKSLACNKILFYPTAVKMRRAYIVYAFKSSLKIHVIEQCHKILKTGITPI